MEQKELPLITISPEMTEACLTAVKIWGQSEQLTQSMGECGELIEALGRYIATVGRHFQGRDPLLNEVTEEATDVMILMLQIRAIDPEKFDAVLQQKFEKFSTKVYRAQFQSTSALLQSNVEE